MWPLSSHLSRAQLPLLSPCYYLHLRVSVGTEKTPVSQPRVHYLLPHSWVNKLFHVPCVLFVGKKLQPPRTSLVPKGRCKQFLIREVRECRSRGKAVKKQCRDITQSPSPPQGMCIAIWHISLSSAETDAEQLASVHQCWIKSQRILGEVEKNNCHLTGQRGTQKTCALKNCVPIQEDLLRSFTGMVQEQGCW